MKLLVVVDFLPAAARGKSEAVVQLSPGSAEVLAEGAKWAGRLSAGLWVLHVAEPDPEFVGYEPGPQTVRDTVAQKFREEHRRLQEEAARLREEGVDATAILAQGPTVETILAEAARLGAAAIVMGAHTHGRVHELLLGSVSKGVLRKSARPVLVVPSHDGG